jgi:hypothetical protein
VRGKQRRNGDVGGVSLSIHANQATAAHIVSNDDSDSASSLSPLDFGEKAATSTLQQRNFARYIGAVPARMCASGWGEALAVAIPTGYIAASQLAMAEGVVAEARTDPKGTAQASVGQQRPEGGGACEEKGRIVVGQTDDGRGREERAGRSEGEARGKAALWSGLDVGGALELLILVATDGDEQQQCYGEQRRR